MAVRASHEARCPLPASDFRAATTALPHGSRLATNRNLLHSATVADSSAAPWSCSAPCTTCQTPRYIDQDIVTGTAVLLAYSMPDQETAVPFRPDAQA